MAEPTPKGRSRKLQDFDGGAIKDASVYAERKIKSTPTLTLNAAFSMDAGIPDTAGDYDVVITRKCVFRGLNGIKGPVNGGAGDTITVKNGTNAITNAISLNLSANDKFSDSTIDPTYYVFNAGDTLRITAAKVTSCACILELRFTLAV